MISAARRQKQEASQEFKAIQAYKKDLFSNITAPLLKLYEELIVVVSPYQKTSISELSSIFI